MVDDELALLAATRRVLVRRGFVVETASSGQQALDGLVGVPPDVVVSDFKMPGMSGVELLAAIAQRYPKTRRILLSGFAEVPDDTDATFLQKPWVIEDLLRLCALGRLPD